MRAVVLGAGAVGSLLGWALATSGAEVTLVRRAGAGRAAPGPVATALAPGRLTVIDPDGAISTVAATVSEGLATVGGPPDLVLCAVRMTDLPAALGELQRWPKVPLLTVQNGVGAEAMAGSRRPGVPLVAASLTAATARQADGAVAWLRRGGIGLAPPDEPLVEDLARRFRAAGLPARIFPDAPAMKWSKLLANLLANASSAILDLDPTVIYRDPALFALERQQSREALAVMAAQGLGPVDLPGAPVRLLAWGMRLPAAVSRPVLARVVGGARGGKAPSLRLHVASGGGPSEGEWLNGAVVAAGSATGVPTPANGALLAALREVTADAARRAWYRGHPERLLALAADWHTGRR